MASRTTSTLEKPNNKLASRRGTIMGLSWRKLPRRSYSQLPVHDDHHHDDMMNDDIVPAPSPISTSTPEHVVVETGYFTRGGPGRRPLSDKINMPPPPTINFLAKVGDVDASAALMKRMNSVRDAFGTIRQKLKSSTRRKKRLGNNSPYPDSIIRTPASARRAARVASERSSEIKMYSPFTIDSPCYNIVDSPAARTPTRGIRMGTHTPRRFNFSSPGHYQTDLKSVEAGIQALSDLGDKVNAYIAHDQVLNSPPAANTRAATSFAAAEKYTSENLGAPTNGRKN